MDLELAVTSARSKARVLESLTSAGFDAQTGPVRLAYPFTVHVRIAVPGETDRDTAISIARSVDPTCGTIELPTTMTTHPSSEFGRAATHVAAAV